MDLLLYNKIPLFFLGLFVIAYYIFVSLIFILETELDEKFNFILSSWFEKIDKEFVRLRLITKIFLFITSILWVPTYYATLLILFVLIELILPVIQKTFELFINDIKGNYEK